MPKDTIILSLPPDATMLVDEHDEVLIGTALAEAKTISHEQSLSISTLLGVHPKQIARFLAVPIGVAIHKGEVIARRRTLLSELLIRAPFDSVITSLNLSKGTVEIQKEAEQIVIKSPVDGKIKKIDKDRITLEFIGKLIQVDRSNGWASGEIVVFSSDTYHLLNAEVTGKIVALDDFTSTLISKLSALEAAAVIIPNKPLGENESSHDNTTILDEEQELPFALIDPKSMNTLISYHGKQAVLDGESRYIMIIG